MPTPESLSLDGIELNNGQPWTILAEGFQFTPAKKKLTWATSSQSDGSSPAAGEDHYENAEMVFTVMMDLQSDSDTARAIVSTLTKKLQEAHKTFGGLPLVWTPSDSATPLTFYVVQAEHDEINISRDNAYFTSGPQSNVHLYLRPFGYVGENLARWSYSEPFLWDSITGGRWRFDSGVGTISVQPAASQLTCSTTALKELFLPWTTFGSSTALQFRIGADLTNAASISLFAKRQDANSYFRVTASASGQALRIIKKDSGDTQVATSDVEIAASTTYWLAMTVDGNDITGAIYADGDNPLDGQRVALTTATYSMTGGEITKFGAASRGNLGIRVQPGATTTDWNVLHFDARDMTQIRSTEPVVGLEVRDVPGHVSAEGRLVLTEASSPTGKTWRHVEWGRESKDYDPLLGWPYMLDSDALDSAAFAGNQAAGFPGAYDPDASGNNVIISSGLSQTVAVTICGTKALQHLGTFKIKARVSGTPGVRVRFKRQVGDGPFEQNLWSEPLAEGTAFGTWFEVDLGTITIERQTNAGVQSWSGRIDAISSDVEGGTVAIDYLMIVPVEAYGKARAPLQPLDASLFTAFDHFNQASGSLDSKVMGTGNIWRSTVGQAGDFQLPVSGEHRVERATLAAGGLTSGHYAIIKTAGNSVLNMTNVQMQTDVWMKVAPDSTTDLTDKMRYGVFIRCPFVSGAADPNNWVMAALQTYSGLAGFSSPGTFVHTVRMMVLKCVAGVVSTLGTVNTRHSPDEKLTVALTADVTGLWQAYVWPKGTRQPSRPQKAGQDSALATGGTLASGGAGIYDVSTMANNPSNLLKARVFDNVALFAATPDAVCFPGKQLEIRSDATRREALSGSTQGEVPRYQGKRFFLEPAGDANRINRVFVKWRETDVDGVPDINVADAAIVRAYVAPRFLYPPGTDT